MTVFIPPEWANTKSGPFPEPLLNIWQNTTEFEEVEKSEDRARAKTGVVGLLDAANGPVGSAARPTLWKPTSCVYGELGFCQEPAREGQCGEV
jgi:hypothetical protein